MGTGGTMKGSHNIGFSRTGETGTVTDIGKDRDIGASKTMRHYQTRKDVK